MDIQHGIIEFVVFESKFQQVARITLDATTYTIVFEDVG